MSPIGRKGPEQRLELRTKDGRRAVIKLPEELQKRLGPVRSETQARPKPEEPPDPRPSLQRNVPPYGGV